jgi:hypothetical protein
MKTNRDNELQKVRLYLEIQDPSLIHCLNTIIDHNVRIPEKEGREILAALVKFSECSGHVHSDETSIFASIDFWGKFIA